MDNERVYTRNRKKIAAAAAVLRKHSRGRSVLRALLKVGPDSSGLDAEGVAAYELLVKYSLHGYPSSVKQACAGKMPEEAVTTRPSPRTRKPRP